MLVASKTKPIQYAVETAEVTSLKYFKIEVINLMSSLLFNSSYIFLNPCTGPLTYTDYKTGDTTLYGLVAGLGGLEECLSATLYARVAEPGILDWIRTHTDAA